MGVIDSGLLVGALVRMANQQGNPVDWLTGLQALAFQALTSGDPTVQTSISTGGMSGSYSLVQNLAPDAAIQLTEQAIRIIQSKMDVLNLDVNGIPTNLNVIQLPPSQQTTSYGCFGGLL